jgi:hypothetical protein
MNKADEQAAEVFIGEANSNGGVGRHFGVGKRGSCGNFFAQQYPSNPAKRQKPKRFTKAELKAIRQTRIKNLRGK